MAPMMSDVAIARRARVCVQLAVRISLEDKPNFGQPKKGTCLGFACHTVKTLPVFERVRPSPPTRKQTAIHRRAEGTPRRLGHSRPRRAGRGGRHASIYCSCSGHVRCLTDYFLDTHLAVCWMHVSCAVSRCGHAVIKFCGCVLCKPGECKDAFRASTLGADSWGFFRAALCLSTFSTFSPTVAPT
eukprot:7389009-Prymnesium_polylepis.2